MLSEHSSVTGQKKMNDIITPEEFVSALAEAAETYTNEICETVEKGIDRIAGETLKEVKELSPVYEGSSKKLKKGRYRKGWKVRKERRRGNIRITVHNEQYQLVHLLELGHCLRDGTGRVYGNVSAIPHVETAETHAEEKVDKLLEGL